MRTWLIVLLFLSGCTPSWAEDGYGAMKDFIRQEDERLKDIKLLSLDLEKAGLELKKKEVQGKMAELSGALVQEKGAAPKADDGEPDIHISGIIINDAVKQAFIGIDGKILCVREGQELAGKMKVTKITGQSVSVQFSDGKTRQLMLPGV